jgi:hypothetical protein
VRERVPDAESGDGEGNLLLRQGGEGEERSGGGQALLVQVPDGEEEQRAGERDRVKLVQRQPLHRRVDEVDEREERAESLGGEMLACEPEHRQRAERDGSRLHREEHRRARPQPPERREGGEDWIDVRAEPVDLSAVELRDVERSALCGRPDCLHHVSEVEAAGLERSMLLHGERPERGCERGHRAPDDERDATDASPARDSRARRVRRRRRTDRAGGRRRGA